MFNKEETWQLLEDEECLIADGFNEAVIGIVYGIEPKAVYSVRKIVDILMKDMSYEDAVEHFEYNIAGSYVGEKTPLYVYDIQEDV
tara:strand:- start:3175 stop:3432 length:258 start_codon:yes stop_codon:yes gene_type:complete